MHSEDEAKAIVDAFLATPPFSGEARHQRRIDVLSAFEEDHEYPPVA